MIRKFKPEDIDNIMDIWLSANIDAHSFIPEDYFINNLSQVKTQIEQAEIYVYESGGVPAGFIGLTESYIAGLFVKKCMRSNGIGSALLDTVLKTHSRLSLSVYSRNKSAVDFYLTYRPRHRYGRIHNGIL